MGQNMTVGHVIDVASDSSKRIMEIYYEKQDLVQKEDQAAFAQEIEQSSTYLLVN